MRVTEKMTANLMVQTIQQGLERNQNLQEQASSGLKINAPSDDPLAAQQVLQLKGVLQDNAQYAKNITTGNAWLGQMDNAMSEMGNIVSRANEIAMSMASGTNNGTSRAQAADEVKQLKSELVQLGNTQVSGKYIFGGFVNDKPPFDTTAINNPSDPLNGTPTGAYIGTDNDVTMQIGKGAYVAINYSGGQLLRGGSPPGSTGVDMIGTLDTLITGLSNNDTNAIQGTLPALDQAKNQILAARTVVGARTNHLQNASDDLDSMNVTLNKLVSDKEDADVIQLYSDLTQQQNAFQSALAAAGKLSNLSLLDYLQ